MTVPSPVVFGLFGTTVDAVYRLVPATERITDANNSGLPTPITEASVAAWIVEVSDMLSGTIGEWQSLTGGAAARITGAARAAVANGVASYVEAARYPSMAGVNDNGYAAVLWARFLTAGQTLAEQVTAEISEGGVDVVNTELSGPFSAGFPEPYFIDGDPYWPWAEPLDPRAAW